MFENHVTMAKSSAGGSTLDSRIGSKTWRARRRVYLTVSLLAIAGCSVDEPTSAGTNRVSLAVSSALSVSLTGATTIPTGGTGRLFRAQAINGVAPYTFEWRQWGGGAPAKVETISQPYADSYFNIYAATPLSTVTVEVTVTDGSGTAIWTSRTTQGSGTLRTNCTWQRIRDVTQPPVPPGAGNAYGLSCGGGPL